MSEHVAEMMPLIYTPTVGEACREFSRIYRKPGGLFLAYEQRRGSTPCSRAGVIATST